VVIPLSSRVPGRASGPSRYRVDDDDGSRYVFGKLIGSLGFSHREKYIAEGRHQEVGQVATPPSGASQG
jgi:hypothetical protein